MAKTPEEKSKSKSKDADKPTPRGPGRPKKKDVVSNNKPDQPKKKTRQSVKPTIVSAAKAKVAAALKAATAKQASAANARDAKKQKQAAQQKQQEKNANKITKHSFPKFKAPPSRYPRKANSTGGTVATSPSNKKSPASTKKNSEIKKSSSQEPTDSSPPSTPPQVPTKPPEDEWDPATLPRELVTFGSQATGATPQRNVRMVLEGTAKAASDPKKQAWVERQRKCRGPFITIRPSGPGSHKKVGPRGRCALCLNCTRYFCLGCHLYACNTARPAKFGAPEFRRLMGPQSFANQKRVKRERERKSSVSFLAAKEKLEREAKIKYERENAARIYAGMPPRGDGPAPVEEKLNEDCNEEDEVICGTFSCMLHLHQEAMSNVDLDTLRELRATGSGVIREALEAAHEASLKFAAMEDMGYRVEKAILGMNEKKKVQANIEETSNCDGDKNKKENSNGSSNNKNIDSNNPAINSDKNSETNDVPSEGTNAIDDVAMDNMELGGDGTPEDNVPVKVEDTLLDDADDTDDFDVDFGEDSKVLACKADL